MESFIFGQCITVITKIDQITIIVITNTIISTLYITIATIALKVIKGY